MNQKWSLSTLAIAVQHMIQRMFHGTVRISCIFILFWGEKASKSRRTEKICLNKSLKHLLLWFMVRNLCPLWFTLLQQPAVESSSGPLRLNSIQDPLAGSHLFASLLDGAGVWITTRISDWPPQLSVRLPFCPFGWISYKLFMFGFLVR